LFTLVPASYIKEIFYMDGIADEAKKTTVKSLSTQCTSLLEGDQFE
jgi:hypothetical protein